MSQQEIQTQGYVILPADEVSDRWADQPWVFAYGSLIWNPGFDVVERRNFVLQDWHRRLCIWSWKYRGTEQNPGLVLGLSPGGTCGGLLYLAQSVQAREVYAYLYAREMVSQVYDPVYIGLTDDVDGPVALTFVANVQSAQYCPDVSFDESVRIITQATGQAGPNITYVLNTCQHLQESGIEDPDLIRLTEHVRTCFPHLLTDV